MVADMKFQTIGCVWSMPSMVIFAESDHLEATTSFASGFRLPRLTQEMGLRTNTGTSSEYKLPPPNRLWEHQSSNGALHVLI